MAKVDTFREESIKTDEENQSGEWGKRGSLNVLATLEMIFNTTG